MMSEDPLVDNYIVKGFKNHMIIILILSLAFIFFIRD